MAVMRIGRRWEVSGTPGQVWERVTLVLDQHGVEARRDGADGAVTLRHGSPRLARALRSAWLQPKHGRLRVHAGQDGLVLVAACVTVPGELEPGLAARCAGWVEHLMAELGHALGVPPLSGPAPCDPPRPRRECLRELAVA
jgi:hypothetical protein